MKKHHRKGVQIWQLLILIILAALICTMFSPAKSKKLEKSQRKTIISLLCQAICYGDLDAMQQVTGTKAVFELLDEKNFKKPMIYASIPGEDWNRARTFASEIELVAIHEEYAVTDPYPFRFDKKGWLLFRFPAKNFVIKNTVIKRGFSKVDFIVGTREIEGFLTNESIFGGSCYFKASSKAIQNVGALVSPPMTISIHSLAWQLVSESDSEEVKTQKLLDFVNEDIKNVKEGIEDKLDVWKRSMEILLTGEGDCSSKTVLFASLLENSGIDYLLGYIGPSPDLVDHAVIYVTGDFEDTTGESFSYKEQNYFLAETTSTKFEIGKSLLTKGVTKNLQFVQRPGGPVYSPDGTKAEWCNAY